MHQRAFLFLFVCVILSLKLPKMFYRNNEMRCSRCCLVHFFQPSNLMVILEKVFVEYMGNVCPKPAVLTVTPSVCAGKRRIFIEGMQYF